MADPFEGSRRKVARAKKHLADLELEIERFNELEPGQIFIEIDPQNQQHEIHKFRLRIPLPPSFADLTADSVNSLRSALDNACYGIAVAAGRVSKPAYTAFPFAKTATDLESQIKGRAKHVPEEIHPVFWAYQPYRGGNDFLWALNEVCNADKHKSFIRVGVGATTGNITGSGGIIRVNIDPVWDDLKQEFELGRFVVNSQVKYKMDLALFVAFDEIEVVRGEPVLRVLNHFVDMVEHILGTLEAECRRLGFVN